MKYTTMLPLETYFGDFKAYFNAAAVRGSDGLTLVDVGLPGFLPKLEETMEKEGLSPGDIKKVIITHCDGDHVGALKALVDKYPGIEVFSSARQAAYITGKQKHPRLEAAEKRYAASGSDEEKKAIAEDMERIRNQETVGTVTALEDGYVFPDSGIEIVEVDGHLPGHICVYVRADKALITGDALTAFDGKLCPPDKNFTLDMTTALTSLKKLLSYEIDNIVCYHGGLVTGSIRQSLEEIIKNSMS
jgi:glyoxylase-like metal-dependent hydrolase (beta-lactamase superfamily II)